MASIDKSRAHELRFYYEKNSLWYFRDPFQLECARSDVARPEPTRNHVVISENIPLTDLIVDNSIYGVSVKYHEQSTVLILHPGQAMKMHRY